MKPRILLSWQVAPRFVWWFLRMAFLPPSLVSRFRTLFLRFRPMSVPWTGFPFACSKSLTFCLTFVYKPLTAFFWFYSSDFFFSIFTVTCVLVLSVFSDVPFRWDVTLVLCIKYPLHFSEDARSFPILDCSLLFVPSGDLSSL